MSAKRAELFALNQRGFTLIELLTVVGLLLVLTTFVAPAIGKWRVEKNIEKDFYALVGAINYLKAKARIVNGTAILHCSETNTLLYSVSDFVQTSTATEHASYAAGILEDKTESILSGKTAFDCASGTKVIFLANGRATSWSGEITYQVSGVSDKVNYSSYKVAVNSATSFVQRYRWNKTSEVWREIR